MLPSARSRSYAPDISLVREMPLYGGDPQQHWGRPWPPAASMNDASHAIQACLISALLVGGCAGTRSAKVLPRPVVVNRAPMQSLETLDTIAEAHYEQGRQAYLGGRQSAAETHFDDALNAYLDAEIEPTREDDLRLAFNEMVNRIHRLKGDPITWIEDGAATDLPEESIPPLTIVEIEMLRARFAATMPVLPRFGIPMPEPLANPKVLAALEHLTKARQEVMLEGLARAQAYLPMIERIFDEEGVPSELRWMPLIESLFKPTVRSWAGAVGMWQLMPGTARLFGLRVDWYIDERRDPVRSTRVAAKLLKDLYREFGDWHLVIASYNAGRGRVGKALRRGGVDDFWSLSDTRHLPRETRDFVPKILAAILIGTDPASYGLFFEPEPEVELRYDEVNIDSMTELRIIAECAGTNLETIRRLNPHLVRLTTPNVSAYTVRIPEGTRQRFLPAFAAIPPSERIQFVEHLVRNGDTLSGIASGYATTVAAIAELNGIRNTHRIRAGTTMLIPIGQSGVVAAIARGRAPRTAAPQPGGQLHTVRRGENLSLIAASYRTSVTSLRQWNDLRSDRIYPGDHLLVSEPTAAGIAEPGADGAPLTHVVRRGDTLHHIARRYGITVADICAWNDMSPRKTLYPGDQLLIHPDTTALMDSDG